MSFEGYKSLQKELPSKKIKEVTEFRMYVVQKRDAQTLVPLIKKNALPGCDIHSDEWRAYLEG